MLSRRKKIVSIGAGYVGGPTMAVMALKIPDMDFFVADVNSQLIQRWREKQYPFYEQGLSEIVEATLDKNLYFHDNIEYALEGASIIFISVNTPTKQSGHGQGSAMDIQYLENCIRKIGTFYNQSKLDRTITIVEKSTVPVRTSRFMMTIIQSSQTNFPENRDKFFMISNPEFLAEGNAIKDLLEPDRVIIGGSKADMQAVIQLKELYLNWVPEERIILTNTFSSELSKLVANSFLAQRVSSINSLTSICDKVGADVDEIAKCVGSDTRIGNKYLKPSIGFGGSCLGKDLNCLIYLAESLELKEVAQYWRAVYDLNEYQKASFSKKIIDSMFNNLSGKVLSIFGFSFKANTNDVRESPALSIIHKLLSEKAILKLYDPKAQLISLMQELKQRFKFEEQDLLTQTQNPEQCVTDSHAIVIITEWEEFKHLDYSNLIKLMQKPSYIFDGRNILNPEKMREIGFEYFGLGKGSIN